MQIINSFNELGLAPALLTSLMELGYETPTPVQQQSIPILNAGHDLLAQAQTGTGKTAAFALPILAQIDIALNQPQALIIAPTRELAIQVAEAFRGYARHLPQLRVASIYGGQDYRTQLRALKNGAHVVVGTPGRLMDHIRRCSFRVNALKTIVLDEADEMLKMGFIEDIEWMFQQVPHVHQTALFSATMPAAIKNISKRYLKDAKRINITPKQSTVDAIAQHYISVSKKRKLDMLTYFLETEKPQGTIIFTRTKSGSSELADKLHARGYTAAALNGDMNQSLRKRTIERLKKGSIDIIVATDVAARGIDVDRISHVINYDMPHDAESYIHRIGRTGRAGRKGTALLFVAPNERRMLHAIETTIRKSINEMQAPSHAMLENQRSRGIEDQIVSVLNGKQKLNSNRALIQKIQSEHHYEPEAIAAALMHLLQQPRAKMETETESHRDDRPRSKFKSSRGRGKPSGRFKKRRGPAKAKRR